MVKRIGSRISVGTAALLVVAGAGAGLPAYASTLEAEQPQEAKPRAQSLTVVESSPAIAIVRDGYSIVVPPRLQYPLLTGTGITSGFGPRGGRMHQGADIFPGYGTPIYSIAAGVVVESTSGGDYGNQVTIEHVIDGQMVLSRYAHMAPGTVAVSTGDQVAVGQQIGAVGETGNAQGAHLHFEIRPGGGTAVNPYPWIAARL
jgi:murein DD-endopeptidase MepM/ murein hydrolase activator NlpD